MSPDRPAPGRRSSAAELKDEAAPSGSARRHPLPLGAIKPLFGVTLDQ